MDIFENLDPHIIRMSTGDFKVSFEIQSLPKFVLKSDPPGPLVEVSEPIFLHGEHEELLLESGK